MALVTVQRSPSPSNSPEHAESDGGATAEEDRSPLRQRSSFKSKSAIKRLRKFFNTIRFISKLNSCFSESYFAVKGTALILPQSECTRKLTSRSHGGDIQRHLQCMLHLLRPQDTLKVAVKLESAFPQRNRYMAVVSCVGRQDTEECLILGIDCNNDKATIGLVLPIWANTKIKLDGDGGFSINYEETHHLFKPVSVQAMWSALQSLHKVVAVATSNHYFADGLTHTWVGYYVARISSDQHCITEWHLREDILPFRENTCLLNENEEQAALKKRITATLREVMMTVDLEEVTSKFLRVKLEDTFGMSLQEHKSYVDEEMLIIMGQMDAPTSVFDFLYLGSEWNASNLEELKENGIGFILNVTREIDNFFPGMFSYMNIREYDVEETDLLKYWEKTYKFINKARKAGSKVLVHCKMGVSRSASTVIAFIMKDRGWSLEETFDFVKQKRSCIKPNKSFMKQLEIYQGILNASRKRYIFKSKSETNLQDPEDLIEELTDSAGDGIFLGPSLHLSRPRSWAPEEDIAASILMQKGLAIPDDGLDYTTGLPVFQLGGEEADVELSSRSTDSVEMWLPDIPSPKTVKPDEDNIRQFELELQCPKAAEAPESGRVPIGRRASPFNSPIGSPQGESSFLPGPMQNMGLSSSWTTTSTPYGFKVRDDSSWIKEASPDTPVTSVPPSNDENPAIVLTDVGVEPKFVNFYVDPYLAEQDVGGEDSCLCSVQQRLHSVECEPIFMDPSPTWNSEKEEQVSKSYGGVHEHYVKEDIPWNPGTVKKQLMDLEHRIRSTNALDGLEMEQSGIGEPPSSSDLQPELNDDMQRDSGTNLQTASQENQLCARPLRDCQTLTLATPPPGETAAELARTRPASVYEIEDISLPVGIVQRTKQEIEEKQRPTPREWIETSFSDLDPVTKPVQRSSSLKVNNSKPKSKKSRSSDRRKTCTPVLSPCNSPDAGVITLSLVQSGTKARKELLLSDSDMVSDELPVQVFKYGTEEVPLAVGNVRRHAQDFENLNSENDARSKSPAVQDEDKPKEEDISNSEMGIATKITLKEAASEVLPESMSMTTKGKLSSSKTESVSDIKVVSSAVSAKTDTIPCSALPDKLPYSSSIVSEQGSPKGIHAKKGSDQSSSERTVPPPNDIPTLLPSDNKSTSITVQPARSQTPSQSRLNKETLFLIREIGSALLNQPMKSDDDVQGEITENLSTVKQIVKRIEHKTQVKTKSFLERIVIIDKESDGKSSSNSKEPLKSSDTVASADFKPSAFKEESAVPKLCSPKGIEESEKSQNSVPARSSSFSSETKNLKRKKATVTKPLLLPLDVEAVGVSRQKMVEALPLGSPCDELPIDGLEAIEDHLVKNLVGKFEVKDSKEDVKKGIDSSSNPSISSGSESEDSVSARESPVKQQQPSSAFSTTSTHLTEVHSSPVTVKRSSSLEDLCKLHRVSDAGSLLLDPSDEPSRDPTSDTSSEEGVTKREGSSKPRPMSVIVTSSCTLGTLKSSPPRSRHTIHSLSSLSSSPSGPHQFLPTEAGQSFSLDGRKVRRMEGKTHPLTKLGWQHSTM